MQKALWLLALVSKTLFADWNHDFDIESSFLLKELSFLNHPDYQKKYQFFQQAREILTYDKILIDSIRKKPINQKLILQKQGFVLKKRKNNRVHDLYPWELSYLLGSCKYILPSFPMEIGGIRVIVQKKEAFTFGRIPKKLLKKITLKTYWEAHLQAYVLGFSDLAANNIGVNEEGLIRFFDNEACLTYYNTPFKNEISFSTGFICESFDWPQYEEPLDDKEAMHLQKFIQHLLDCENSFKRYLEMRSFPLTTNLFLERLEKLRQFRLKKAVRFLDFFEFLYPSIGRGLKELTKIVEAITGKKHGYGSALFFICTRMNNYKLSSKDRLIIQKWVDKYIP